MKHSSFSQFALAILLLGFITGCESKYGFTHLKDTPIQADALPNHSMVQVLYASGGPDLNEEVTYLYRYKVVIVGSSDTINVLSPARTKISAENDVKEFVAARSEEDADRALLEGAFQGKTPIKIASNLPYKEMEQNSHPTVIGLLTFPEVEAPEKR